MTKQDKASIKNLDARVRLWLVRAWVRIPFAAIFADIRHTSRLI